jgi:hypothetical protein
VELRDRVSAVSRHRVGALALCALTLAWATPAAVAASSEAGRYRFEAFVPGVDDPRLPLELRARPRSSMPAELLATDRAVEIAWVGNERPGLRGYRLTATIDGGPLSGLAARWTVAPASGEQTAPLGPRQYRVHLPLPVDGHLRLHAALEAVREDGSAVLLAVTHSTPARSDGSRWLPAPAWRGLGPVPAQTVVLTASAWALSPEREWRTPHLRSEPGLHERPALFSANAASPGRPRGPPSSC